MMKKTKKVLALILGMILAMGLTVSVGTAEDADGNLLQNPSFENGLTGWTAKRGNSVAIELVDLTATTDYTAEFTAPAADSGTKYVAFPESSAQSILTQRVEGLQAGTAYAFSGWGYATKADKENTYVTYSFYNGDTVISAQDVLMSLPLESWVMLQTTFIMPEGASAVEVGVKTTGGDTFTRSYDHFSLKATENILSNPSFESGLSSWTSYRKTAGGPLTGTTLYGTEEGVTAPAADCGTSYVAFPTNSGTSYLTQRVSGLVGGATYMFSGLGYTDNINAAVTAPDTNYTRITCAYYKDGEAEAVGTDTLDATLLLRNWGKLQATILLPEDVNAIEIGITTTGGDAYLRKYDNFSLVKMDNLLLNPGFEDCDLDTKEAEGWLSSAVGATYVFKTTDTHTGNVAYAADDWARIEQAVPAAENTRYKLTYWYKSQSTETAAAANVRVRFFDARPTKSNKNPGTSTSALNVMSTALLPGDGWQQHVAYFTTPAGTKGISVVLHGYSGNYKGVCIYDDIELSVAEGNIEFLGFSTTEPESVGCATTQNTSGSYVDSGLYEAAVKNPATTLSYADGVTNGSAIYASAVDADNDDSLLVYGMFAEREGTRTLEEVRIVKPDANGILSAGITVPETGTHTLEVYLWNSAVGLRPVMAPIELK